MAPLYVSYCTHQEQVANDFILGNMKSCDYNLYEKTLKINFIMMFYPIEALMIITNERIDYKLNFKIGNHNT